MKKCLMSKHQEAQQLKIHLDERTSILFSIFVGFPYQPTFQFECTRSDRLLVLAEAYPMGARLVAPRFQEAIFQEFIRYAQRLDLASDDLCHLLIIACSQITERINPSDDPMRNHIFLYAASKLTKLQMSEKFKKLLRQYEELGRQLVLRAGNRVSVTASEHQRGGRSTPITSWCRKQRAYVDLDDNRRCKLGCRH